MDFQSGMVALAPESGGGFKIVRKAEWGESGERGEILKSCAKLNGESLGWCLPVGTHYYLLLISVQSEVWIATNHSRGGGPSSS